MHYFCGARLRDYPETAQKLEKVKQQKIGKMEKKNLNTETASTSTNGNFVLKNEAAKNLLWRIWDFAKYHKEVVEQDTNYSGTAMKCLFRSIMDAENLLLLANGMPVDSTTAYPIDETRPTHEGIYGKWFAQTIASNGVVLSNEEKDMLTRFDVAEWYYLAVDELKTVWGWDDVAL